MLCFSRGFRYHRLDGQNGPFSNLSLFLLAFCLLYILAILIMSQISARDPTSVFFRPALGYQREYSLLRQAQTESYIATIPSEPLLSKYNSEHKSNGICIGIVTFARKDVRYFRSAVGSLLEGLDSSEQERIYLVSLITHTDPTMHPAFSESWLGMVSDEVLLYNKSVSREEMDYLRRLEKEDKEFREKPLFDYSYLLQACMDVETPYIAMLEDDVIAMDGWFHRTWDALRTIETKVSSNKNLAPPLYLRLFYTERYLGWNSEEWPTYLGYSILTAILLASFLALIWKFCPRLRSIYTRRHAIVVFGICLPASIILFFMSGRITTLPLPHGVNLMNNFGCCSQGLVFPRERVPDLIKWYKEKKIGYVDMLTEEYADRFGYSRWAVSPSVLQHIGGKTSKEGTDGVGNGGLGRSQAETIWNFEFERYRADELREGHALALDKVWTI